MALMAEAYGADIRLVAFMQYLRVVARRHSWPPPSVRIWMIGSAGAEPAMVWLPPIQWVSVRRDLALACCSASLRRIRRAFPPAPCMLPLIAGGDPAGSRRYDDRTARHGCSRSVTRSSAGTSACASRGSDP